MAGPTVVASTQPGPFLAPAIKRGRKATATIQTEEGDDIRVQTGRAIPTQKDETPTNHSHTLTASHRVTSRGIGALIKSGLLTAGAYLDVPGLRFKLIPLWRVKAGPR